MRGDVVEADGVMAAIRDAALRVTRPRRIILFGSRAQGTGRADSDYDVIIVADMDRPAWQVSVDVRTALGGIPAALDLIVLTPAEWEQERRWISSIVSEAEETGRVLYEAPD